jgi:hypothetical protein
VIARAKFDAWKSMGKMTLEEGKKKFVEELMKE